MQELGDGVLLAEKRQIHFVVAHLVSPEDCNLVHASIFHSCAAKKYRGSTGKILK